MKKVLIGLASGGYEILVSKGQLGATGSLIKPCLGRDTRRLAIISNKKVFRLYGEALAESIRKAGFEAPFFLMGDGERFKTLGTLEKALGFLSAAGLERGDAVVALGGGVVGDLAGFASSVYLRGVSFVQVPTTFLAMIDSSVGGKTGVNSSFGKNLVGAFHQPKGGFIDINTLKTLPHRELAAGFYEAIKHGAVSGPCLFEQTRGFLAKYPLKNFGGNFSDEVFTADLESLLAAQVSFKAKIISGDEREEAGRNDSASRKILNFGHTIGHALEKTTKFQHFKHGEAVGFGMLAAAEISKNLEIISENDVKLLNDVVCGIGKMPKTNSINPDAIAEAIAFDKKAVNGTVKWILLNGIGQPIILDGKEISVRIIKRSIEKILKKFA